VVAKEEIGKVEAREAAGKEVVAVGKAPKAAKEVGRDSNKGEVSTCGRLSFIINFEI
jgi:hypothetical protein